MEFLPRRIPKVPPNICTLVGPTKHYKSFDRASLLLGMKGWLVFSIGSHRTDDAGLGTTDNDRRTYWHTHRQKIMASAMVFVVDVPNDDCEEPRIGIDTIAEIKFAWHCGVPVIYQSRGDDLPEAPGYEHNALPPVDDPTTYDDVMVYLRRQEIDGNKPRPGKEIDDYA